MSNTLGGVHIVDVTYSDGKVERWVAATARWEARAAVSKRIPADATAKLVNDFLSWPQIADLRLPPGGVRKLTR